jgi:hypothetical protein
LWPSGLRWLRRWARAEKAGYEEYSHALDAWRPLDNRSAVIRPSAGKDRSITARVGPCDNDDLGLGIEPTVVGRPVVLAPVRAIRQFGASSLVDVAAPDRAFGTGG